MIGLFAMYFFSTTLVSACTAITMLTLSGLYTHFTGVYWFVDSGIPIAVFLGLHLLITDPSTSPRTLTGKAIFGICYGTLVFAGYGILAQLGWPTFYDKLLPVPILNLCVRMIDRLVASPVFARWNSGSVAIRLSPARLNVAFMAVWITFFIVVNRVGILGDTHPGHQVPFWQQACSEGRRDGCRILQRVEEQYCSLGSGWACNEYGINLIEGKVFPANPFAGAQMLSTACRLGTPEACGNALFALSPTPEAQFSRSQPTVDDFKILLRNGKAPLPEMPQEELLKIACTQHWPDTCGRR